MRCRRREARQGHVVPASGSIERRRDRRVLVHRLQLARGPRPHQREGDGRPANERHDGPEGPAVRRHANVLGRVQDDRRGLRRGRYNFCDPFVDPPRLQPTLALTLNLLLRGGTLLVLVLIAAALWRDHPRTLAARLGAVFALGVAASTLASAPGFSAAPTAWHAVISALAS